MNRKLSLIILFLLFASLISVLLIFMSYSKSGNSQEINELKTGYEQLSKQVNELKVTTDELGTKVEGEVAATQPKPQTAPTAPQNPPSTTQPVVTTKQITGDKVNMRNMANAGAKVLRQLPKGEIVTPTGETAIASGYQWVKVKDSQGNEGWVITTYVK